MLPTEKHVQRRRGEIKSLYQVPGALGLNMALRQGVLGEQQEVCVQTAWFALQYLQMREAKKFNSKLHIESAKTQVSEEQQRVPAKRGLF